MTTAIRYCNCDLHESDIFDRCSCTSAGMLLKLIRADRRLSQLNIISLRLFTSTSTVRFYSRTHFCPLPSASVCPLSYESAITECSSSSEIYTSPQAIRPALLPDNQWNSVVMALLSRLRAWPVAYVYEAMLADDGWLLDSLFHDFKPVVRFLRCSLSLKKS